MIEKQYFIAFFGAYDPENTPEIREAVRQYPLCRQVMDRTYMIGSDNPADTTISVRDKIMTDDSYHVIVIRFDGSFSAAWCTSKDNSIYLTDLYKEIVHGK